MTNRIIFSVLGLIYGLIFFASLLYAEDKPTDTSTSLLTDHIDVIDGAINPFREGEERAKFLRAGGPDSELEKSEFLLDKEKEKGFVRSFDKWELIIKLDQNRNEKIDWLEARSYREAIWALILPRHDSDKDGKLNPNERHDAIHALLEGKLAAYFGASCCGGQSSNLTTQQKEQVEARQQQLRTVLGLGKTWPGMKEMRSVYLERKKKAIQDDRLINGVSESRMLNFTQPAVSAEIQRQLRPHYEAVLSNIMTEKDWQELCNLLSKKQQWWLDANPEGLAVAAQTTWRLSGKEMPVLALQEIESLAELTMRHSSSGPALRMGFVKEPIRLRTAVPLLSFSEEVTARLPKSFHKDMGREQHVITITSVLRVAPTFTFTGSASLRDSPDGYNKVVTELVYNPERNYPFVFLPGEVSRIGDQQLFNLIGER